MKHYIIVCLCLIYCSNCFCQSIHFASPLIGQVSKDFFIDYYFDHDPGYGISDPFCGNKTYDGHRGTDYILRSFKLMDSGVFVYAVADGRIGVTNNGVDDRRKHLTSGGLGNYIEIIHEFGYSTYYGHLMKNSLLVKSNEIVKKGQKIAKVGSSGYSCFPHLHLEVRKDQMAIDPFNNCYGGTDVIWDSNQKNDTSVYAISSGFVPYVPNYDSLLEEYLVRDTFNLRKDTTICLWVLVHGFKKDNVIHAEWYRPNGDLWFKFEHIWKYNFWHDYDWTYIAMPRSKGKWRVKYFINDSLLLEKSFFIK